MAVPKSQEYNTFEDFLILSETSRERMEYINGEIVYLFESGRGHVEIYDFTQQIPVGIYQDEPVQLSLCISELM